MELFRLYQTLFCKWIIQYIQSDLVIRRLFFREFAYSHLWNWSSQNVLFICEFSTVFAVLNSRTYLPRITRPTFTRSLLSLAISQIFFPVLQMRKLSNEYLKLIKTNYGQIGNKLTTKFIARPEERRFLHNVRKHISKERTGAHAYSIVRTSNIPFDFDLLFINLNTVWDRLRILCVILCVKIIKVFLVQSRTSATRRYFFFAKVFY